MCELLGMSSNHRTTINLSLTTLAERGENPNLHGDGWGVAYYEGNDVRLIKDAGQARGSEWVDFIKKQEIQSHDIIAHIRKSTVGEVSYRNTHPFIRELHGRMHSFAHNGTFREIQTNCLYHTQNFHPIGTTDSEHAFCVLMDRMTKIWETSKKIPTLENRLEVFNEFTHDMKKLGTCNFLYSDGDILLAHGHQRHDPITNQTQWPGLHFISAAGGKKGVGFKESPESGGISVAEDNRFITLFASVPLNDGKWIPLQEGQVIAVRKGKIIFQ